jgi:hypothetical protein
MLVLYDMLRTSINIARYVQVGESLYCSVYTLCSPKKQGEDQAIYLY